MNATGRWFPRWVFISILSVVLTAPSRPVAAPNDAVVRAGRASAPEWRAKSRSEHQTEWFSVHYVTNPATGRVRATTNSYIEIGTGLNRRDPITRKWQASDPSFQITAAGAEANLAGHRVRISGNINSAGAVLIEKDGVKMQGHPLCIALYDPVDGRSELLAELTDAEGGAWLVSSNEIVFSNCFAGLRASIRYRNSVSGLEQDLLLHERPAITPQDLGFSDKTRLELFTEWIGDTPVPQKETRVLQHERNVAVRQQMVEPDFGDSTLMFGNGKLRMAQGRAFTTGGGQSAVPSVPVGKRFELIDGRKILIEAVPLAGVQSMLDKLPAARVSGVLTNAAIRKRSGSNVVQLAQTRPGVRTPVRADPQLSTLNNPPSANLLRRLPAKRLAQTKADHRIQTASIPLDPQRSTNNPQLAFVLDWVLQLDDPIYNFTFRGDTTYRCSGTVNLDGTTTIEAGTVVKYDEGSANAILQIFGPLNCKTELYRPAFFTSVKDHTVGISFPVSGTPGRYFQALAIGTTGQQLKHLRISYAQWALHAFEIDLRHSQITHCDNAFATDGWLCNVANVLVHNVGTVFMGYDYTATATHLTVNQCNLLTSGYWGPDSSSVSLFNSLIVNVADYGWAGFPAVDYTQFWEPGYPPADYPFQTAVGAGAHYLANNPLYRNAGTTSIDPTLLSEIRSMTTDPPIVHSDTASPNLILAPRPIADTGLLELGYHYPIVDYALNSLSVEGTTVLLTNGVVVTPCNSYGFWIKGGEIVSEGVPDRPNRILPYTLVQEQKTLWNNVNPSSTTAIYPFANAGQVPSKMRLRFTLLDKHQYSGYHAAVFESGMAPGSRFALQDSHLLGGDLWLEAGMSSGVTLGLTNTAFENMTLTFNPSPNLALYNNLFSFSTAWLAAPSGSAWRIHDNIFRNTYVGDGSDAPPIHTHNAFVACTYENFNTSATGNQMLPPGTGDIPLNELAFEPGPFGDYYLPTSATYLINSGSRNAVAAGLFHYTTTLDQVKERNSTVDIGLHYPAAAVVNLALNKSATQSSTYGGAVAERAVDGITDGNYFNNSVSTTLQDYPAWWEVNLGEIKDIDAINVWNRTDCCPERLSEFYVFVSDTPFSSTDLNTILSEPGVSSYYFSGIAGTKESFVINRTGRYVRVQLTWGDYLSLAEVEVLGHMGARDMDGDGSSDYFDLDADGDGLPDAWELTYGFMPDDTLGINGADGDPDGDSVSNYAEYLQGRRPNNSGTIPDSTGAFISLKVITP